MFGHWGRLWQAIAPYKNRNPGSIDEEEYLENLFNSLCACLMSVETRDLFNKAEGTPSSRFTPLPGCPWVLTKLERGQFGGDTMIGRANGFEEGIVIVSFNLLDPMGLLCSFSFAGVALLIPDPHKISSIVSKIPTLAAIVV